MAKPKTVGRIQGVFDGALDGIAARLISEQKCGYLVELLEPKGPFRKGDIVHVSPGEFLRSAVPAGAVPLTPGRPWTSTRS